MILPDQDDELVVSDTCTQVDAKLASSIKCHLSYNALPLHERESWMLFSKLCFHSKLAQFTMLASNLAYEGALAFFFLFPFFIFYIIIIFNSLTPQSLNSVIVIKSYDVS